MKNVFIGLIIGMLAGLFYIVPLLYHKLNKKDFLYAFLYWVVLGIVIPLIDIGMDPWMKGFLIGEIATIPLMIIFHKIDKSSIVSTILFSGMIGVGVSLVGAIYMLK
jgi:hypothetical protein